MLAGQAQAPTDPDALPAVLRELSYDQFRDIRFNKAAALWSGQALFNVEFFHLGFFYREPLTLFEGATAAEMQAIPYDGAQFDYGKNEGLREQLPATLGHAGFRVHYPLNGSEYKDEVIVFLGASYFRLVGRGQVYGLSARGLAIDTALPTGEEFPRFSKFWLVRPEPEATALRFYALLDSRSVTGAYRFDLLPGADTALEVKARLFARKDVARLGVAPLTSMFFYGENRVRSVEDYRPEVHDSDGLLMQTGAGEWIWRPLTNDGQLSVSSLLDQHLGGFGLLQRDRNFDSYYDLEAHYQRRPSLWVEPLEGNWGPGAVQLVEIPAGDETNDNIVAYWVADQPLRAGEERSFSYRLRTLRADPQQEHVARVVRTRIGRGAVPGTTNTASRTLHQFMVEFAGGELPTLGETMAPEPELTQSAGEARDLSAERLPDGNWRVAFKLDVAEGQVADMRLRLTLRGKSLSETWNYVWRGRTWSNGL